MDWVFYIREIRFASPLFMAGLGMLFLVLYVIFAQRHRSPILHSYLAFFHKALLKKKRDPFLLFYRILPYLIAVALVLAVGNPVREKSEARLTKMVPYSIYLDSSGSLASFNASGNPSVDFTDSMLNTARVSLMRFVEERKETSEFFLMLYSDTPYAARYFSGGSEAHIQITGFLDDLPREIKRWQSSYRKLFYLKGTGTAFALEAGMRYRMSLPQDYRESVFILITDLKDTQVSKVAEKIDMLIESGTKRGVYVVVLSSVGSDQDIISLESILKHKSSVRIFQARDRASLDFALGTIGEAEMSPEDVNVQVLRTKSLQSYVVLSAILLTVLCIGMSELAIRRIP